MNDRFLVWDGLDERGNSLGSGVYHYTLRVPNSTPFTGKMVRAR